MKSNYRLLTQKEFFYYTYEQMQPNTTKNNKNPAFH